MHTHGLSPETSPNEPQRVLMVDALFIVKSGNKETSTLSQLAVVLCTLPGCQVLAPELVWYIQGAECNLLNAR